MEEARQHPAVTAGPARPSKFRSVALLVLAEIAGMSLWFTSAAVLPDMVSEGAITPSRQALLSTGVQAGFVVGALLVAITGLADRFDPRKVMAISSVLAALANAVLLVAALGGDLAIAARFFTGVLLAGVYPVGMKLAIGWGTKDRGFLVGLVVGALTLGNGVPFLMAFFGGAEWRLTVVLASLFAAGGPPALGPITPNRRDSSLAPSAWRGPTSPSAAPISAISATCGNSSRCGPGSERR